MIKRKKETALTLKGDWFERTERIEAIKLSSYGDPSAPIGHEVYRCEMRFYVVKVDRKGKGENRQEQRTLLLETPDAIKDIGEITSAGFKSRESAEMVARVLQLAGQ